MKKIVVFMVLMFLFSTNVFSWDSETGSGVVSTNETIVRTSLEATQVLQSDTLTNLYGTTILGGTVNYASFNSGGVASFRNVVSSIDVVNLNRNQWLAYLPSVGNEIRVGVSNDNIYTIGTNARVQGRVSATDVAVSSIFTTSINTTHVRVSGGTTLTSTYTTGTCSFQFNNGLLTVASC